MLWVSIIGMTDLIIHNKTGANDFDDEIIKCNNSVQKLDNLLFNKLDNNELSSQSSSKNKKEKDLFHYVTVKSKNKPIGTIMIEQELKLMLLRHWTLYESMHFSNYIVTKFHLWTEPGQ